MLSCERRQERYIIIYSWKILQGLIPDCGLSVGTVVRSRRGRTLAIPPRSGSRVAVLTLREKSFFCEGPRLFNSLPADIRDLDVTLPTFKEHEDQYLRGIPDQPAVPGYIPGAQDMAGRPSNAKKD
jgi:hypothetical protein